MQSRITFSRASAHAPLAKLERPQRPLELVVPYTNPALAAQALAIAAELAQGFEASVTLVAVYVLPYPSPLECQEGIRQRMEADLTAMARTSPLAIRVKLVFARDREAAYLALLNRQSLVVIGAKDRWWTTPEDRLARRLTSSGHSVAVVKVR